MHSGFRRIFPDVESYRSIAHLFFGFRNTLEMKQILGPGWHHYLSMEVVGPGRIRQSLASCKLDFANEPVARTYRVFPNSRSGRPARRSLSIRSRGTPLVSGTKRKQNQMPANERTAYNSTIETSKRCRVDSVS